MTPKQKAWTDKQINLIIDPIKKVGPLSMTDEQWEAVNNRIDHVIRLAKGNKEVREALLMLLSHMIKWLIPVNKKRRVHGLWALF